MAKRVFTQTFGVVGAIIERDGKFLLVQEGQGHVKGLWNQPAGWIDVGEDVVAAVKREVKEETGYDFTPTHLLGVYSLAKHVVRENKPTTAHAIKLLFTGEISDEQAPLLPEIQAVEWFTPEEIEKMGHDTLRDLDIKKAVQDYLQGIRYPLDLISHTEHEGK